MLIVALVLAVIGLAALVAAVVTSNEVMAWVCIGASALGVLLLIIDAVRERAQRRVPVSGAAAVAAADTEVIEPLDNQAVIETREIVEESADDAANVGADAEAAEDEDSYAEDVAVEDYPDEVVHDDPDYDLPSDDEPDFPEPAEVAAIHMLDEERVDEDALVEADEAFGGDEDLVGEEFTDGQTVEGERVADIDRDQT